MYKLFYVIDDEPKPMGCFFEYKALENKIRKTLRDLGVSRETKLTAEQLSGGRFIIRSPKADFIIEQNDEIFLGRESMQDRLSQFVKLLKENGFEVLKMRTRETKVLYCRALNGEMVRYHLWSGIITPVEENSAIPKKALSKTGIFAFLDILKGNYETKSS